MTIDPALLEPGERLVWSGRPDVLRYTRAKGGIKVMAGLAALVIANAWLEVVTRQRNPMAWTGIVLFVIALGLLLTPVWRAWRAYRTAYALTDRRVLTVIGPPFARRISVPLSQIQSVELSPRPGGVGDVLMQDGVVRRADSSVAGRNGFIAIPEAAQVERLLRSSLPAAAAKT